MLDSQSQCCSNPLTLDAASGGGHVENIAGFNTYASGSLESKLALLLVSDGFGSWNSLSPSLFVFLFLYLHSTFCFSL
ncbi:hypothetical protein V6N12_030507 [Hibiscus sabdariffa]|uniref:Uncharacterized protein n=1 Tax=Hibiscus sabdariffa TaxID=183260 RepID=A0ABR2BBA2_9ROSI